MLFLLWFLLMKVLQTDAAELVTVNRGESVLLTSRHLQGLKRGWDVRWTHPHLLMSLCSNEMMCHHKRCRMRNDGALAFEQVQSVDAGLYRLEVFDASGQRQMKEDFLLKVEGAEPPQGNTSVQVCVSVLLLLIIIIIVIVVSTIIRRRRSQTPRSSGCQEENVYMIMHSHHGNKTKVEEEKQEKEEESHYVRFHPVVSTAKPITQQKTTDEEHISV